ncbi:hypothetical protein B0T13DRAFT_61036 [Neurospora crassa]|nr:hypothetical protein B0T13DRAFT_61036 [Neurospora crassa]
MEAPKLKIYFANALCLFSTPTATQALSWGQCPFSLVEFPLQQPHRILRTHPEIPPRPPGSVHQPTMPSKPPFRYTDRQTEHDSKRGDVTKVTADVEDCLAVSSAVRHPEIQTTACTCTVGPCLGVISCNF